MKDGVSLAVNATLFNKALSTKPARPPPVRLLLAARSVFIFANGGSSRSGAG